MYEYLNGCKSLTQNEEEIVVCSRRIGGGALKIYDFNGSKNVSGDRIHQRRTASRISQGELAARMQINGVTIEREAISKIETGDRFVADYELMVFAKVLGVSVEWLLGMME